MDAAALNASIAAANPGDVVRLTVIRAGREMETQVALAHKIQRSFGIVPIAAPDALQAAILEDWLRPC